LPGGHSVQEDLERALAAARRAADMSGLMLAYLGQNAGHRIGTDLSQVVHDTVRTLRDSAPANVRLTSQGPVAGPMVSGDAAQLAQVLSNLVTNAWEALGAKAGEVRISLSSIPVAAIPLARVVATDWEPTAASYACLEVADDGAGMSPAIQDKIFDPFFTTKSGRGLGLPVVLGTVRAHDGAVAVRSVETRGTTFQVFLPELVSAVRMGVAVSDKKPGNGFPATGGLVLVADDEEIVRQMTRRILVKLGYEVVTVADGAEAVERFRQQADAFHLVLLDLTMPGLDGWAALAAIRAVRPAMPVILASGYDGTQVMAGEHAELPQVFLHKPYLMDDLKGAIDRALAPG
jgi:CheY-like chemotaxis protein